VTNAIGTGAAASARGVPVARGSSTRGAAVGGGAGLTAGGADGCCAGSWTCGRAGSLACGTVGADAGAGDGADASRDVHGRMTKSAAITRKMMAIAIFANEGVG
jgi:hypothetical protein